MSRRLLFFLALVTLYLSSSLALAGKRVPTCTTPRDAADSVFLWQLGSEQNPRVAATCFEAGGRNGKELALTAHRLKAVYDAQGAFVVMDKISERADYLDPANQQARVVPHASLPEVVIEKRGERWLWTSASLDWVDNHYEQNLAGIGGLVASLPTPFHAALFGVMLWQYLALALLIVLGLLVRTLISAVVAVRVKRLGEKLGQRWTAKIVDVFASPGATLLTAVVLRVGYPNLMLPVGLAAALASTVRVLIIISLMWATYRSVDLLGAWLGDRAEKTESKLDDQLVPLITKSLKVTVAVLGGLVILHNLDVNVLALVTSLSIGTLAVGLAAKDTLANLFGSISIFVDSPFQIGDWIRVGGVDGTVEEVGFRSTRLRTFYNSVVCIPNSKVADAKVDNYGLRKYRRCFTTLGLTYDTPPEKVQAFVEGCRAVIQANSATRKDYYEVHMSGYGDSSLQIMLYFFFECDTWTEELRERHNVYLEILRLAQDLDVQFAFPTQSLHVETVANPTAAPTRDPLQADELSQLVAAYGPGGASSRPGGPQITSGKFVPGLTADRGDDVASEAG